MAASAASGVSGTSAPASASGAPAPAAAPSAPSTSQTRQSIFEAVDGSGVEPGLPEWKEPAQESKQKRTSKAKALSVAPAASQAAVTSETFTEDPVHPDVLKLFENELNPQGAQSPEGEDAELGEEGDDQLSDRGQKRFQVLANRAKAAEAGLAQANQNLHQMQGYIGQLTEMAQSQKVENAKLTTAVQMLMQRQNMPQQQQQEVDPAAEFRNRLRDDTLKQISPVMRKELQARDQQINQLKNYIQQREAKQESAVNQQRYIQDSETAVRDVVLKGIEADDLPEGLAAEVQNYVMGAAWAHRTNMAEAAKMFRQTALKVGLAFVKAQSKANRAKMTDRQNAPANMPNSNGGARGSTEPSWKEIKDSGAKDALDFMMKRDGVTR